MQSLKERIINEIISKEGGYVNDKSDSGGETNFGITVSVARESGYIGEMKALPRTLAFSIYSKRYWDAVLADKMTDAVAAEVVDTAVNMGVSRAVNILQRSLNALNNNTSTYADVVVDGKIGSATISALNSYLSKRDESTLIKALNCLQGSFYIELCEKRKTDERFVYGWLNNRVVL